VDDFLAVHVLERHHDAGEEEAAFVFFELAAVAEMVAEVAAVAVVHDQVEVLPVLERADHVDQEGAAHLLQQLLLVHH
jgi:hypothetical protein